MADRACTISSACSVSRAAQVTSTRSCSWRNGVTSSAVTAPPACSTAWVSSLTARPRDGTSSRTVIEYDTLGATVTPLLRLPARVRQAPARRACASHGQWSHQAWCAGDTTPPPPQAGPSTDDRLAFVALRAGRWARTLQECLAVAPPAAVLPAPGRRHPWCRSHWRRPTLPG